MDPGHFLTNSGSKIPMPKSKKENIPVVPVKPKLTTTAVTTTNYIGDIEEDVSTIEKNVKKLRQQTAVNLKTTSSNSVPNLSKSTNNLIRSKTNLNLKSSSTNTTGVKRTAATTENPDAPAVKQSKAAPKTGFPYKAKTWELKARLAECESWVIDLRTKCNDLEAVKEELHHCKLFINDINAEQNNLRKRISDLETEKLNLEDNLRNKTVAYDKLHEDSKGFLSKIEMLDATVLNKDNEISILKANQNKLREEILTKDSSISQMRLSIDEFEFRAKRQKSEIEDLEKVVEQFRSENLMLRNRLLERSDELTELKEKLDKTERDNKIKTSSLSSVEDQYFRSREDISRLEKVVTDMKNENQKLQTQLGQVNSELTGKKSSEESLITACDDLKKKLCESEKLRRHLHNTVQDLKGNIRVFCRVRPPIPSEKENSTPLCTINFPDEGSLEISKGDPFAGTSSITSRPKFVKHEFSFDRIFNPMATQSDVFDELSQLVQSALDGYNVCVFAYGQTGSGKTYTMEGENSKELRGMIPRTVDHIFKSVRELELIGWQYTVEVSFLEIYNEIVRDLLSNDKEGSSLKIMQGDGKTNDVTIPGLTVMKVDSYEDLDRLYLLAQQNRAVAYTVCNERSSRSHSVTWIKVTGIHEKRGERCFGSLYLVDLAGSERLNEPMSDPRFREMKNINKSLSELGNVILGLLQKQEYIPYRNSKLTYLLQPALGGSSKTLMLVNISPAEHCLQETLCSLRFAEKVNKVKMGTTKKRITYDNAALK